MDFLVNPEFAGAHERNTDLLVVYKGFGWQLHDYAYFVRHLSGLNDYLESEEGKWMKTFYMTDEEIKQAIFRLNGYYISTGAN